MNGWEIAGDMIDPRQVADALVAAERERKPIAPFTDIYPFLDVGRAYQAQRLFVEDHLNGDQVVGAKLGMTSKVKRIMLGVEAPVSGWLTAGMVLAPGQPVPLEGLIHPQAEPEIAIVLGREPALPATITSVLSATEAAFHAFLIECTGNVALQGAYHRLSIQEFMAGIEQAAGT